MRALVAGVGSEYRGDDGVGPAVARRVQRLNPQLADVGPVTEPLDLVDRWDGADLVVLVDAVRSGAAPGTISVVELTDAKAHRPAEPTSTHGIGLVRVLRLAQALDRAPRRVLLVGVEGGDFGPGTRLSPAVAAAVPEAAALVIRVTGRTG